jgi:hypothetical protein
MDARGQQTKGEPQMTDEDTVGLLSTIVAMKLLLGRLYALVYTIAKLGDIELNGPKGYGRALMEARDERPVVFSPVASVLETTAAFS